MNDRLFLIDGHALVFKMYYAFLKHPMINSKGADMSILFGFTKYILELIEKEQPTHLAVAFDPPGKTFRHEMFPQYKGTREATPQLVIDSLEPLVELCRAMNIPVLMVPGYEADDVIGSMAKRCEKEGYNVYMVTPDKDYGQLVSDRIFQFKPGKSGSENELLDKKGICMKYGISSPEQVVELLTICGDASDNVPGVKGVGEVGAGKLIAKYGTVANIYAHIGELTDRQKASFEAARSHIKLSHDLVTIKTDIPLDIDTEETVLDMEYNPVIADLFEKYEFTSLRKYIRHVDKGEAAEDKTHFEYAEIPCGEMCALASKSGRISVITECCGDSFFSEIKKVIIGIGTEKGKFVSEGTPADFADILSDKTVDKFGYELKFQYNVLQQHGTELGGRLMDIELMHYLINPEKSHKLETLCRSYLDINLEGEAAEPKSQATLFDPVEDEAPGDNRHKEAAVMTELGEKVLQEMCSLSLDNLYFKIEEPLIRVLADMERTGVKIDTDQLRTYAASLSEELEAIQSRIREMAGEPELNIMSPKQIGTVLFEKLRLDPKIKAKSGVRYSYPTDEETIAALAGKHPIINEILEFRAVKKLLSTYIEPLPAYISPASGKIHTTFNQALTATGRLSSIKPNLQNIPVRTERGKEIRKAFIPSSSSGVILSADYSQIELRIMAHLSRDRHLVEAFEKGQDVHAITASKIFGTALGDVTPDQRRIAKTANFGIMYGISAFGLSQRLKIPRADAKKIIDDYFLNFPTISSYIENAIESAKEKGYVETLFGRRRYLPDIRSKNATARSLAERNAINAPIQGTAADIIKLAMINVSEKMKENGIRSRMILQVHDELVFDAVETEIDALTKIVVAEMENVIELSIPLTVECNYGKNWLEAH